MRSGDTGAVALFLARLFALFSGPLAATPTAKIASAPMPISQGVIEPIDVEATGASSALAEGAAGSGGSTMGSSGSPSLTRRIGVAALTYLRLAITATSRIPPTPAKA